MKRRTNLALASVMLFAAAGLASCGGDASSSATSSAGDEYDCHVGIIQLVQHTALDAASKGFEEALSEKMEAAGKSIEIETEVADGTRDTCTSIAASLVSKKVDLIMANATAALQAAVNVTSTIPILGTSITDYGTALDMEWTGVTGINVSGTTDLAPLDQQAKEMKTLFGLDVNSTVALLYCAAEANSKYQVTEIAKYLNKYDIKSKEYPFTDSNDIVNVCSKISQDKVTAVYIPTDNTAASATLTIDNAFRNKIPVYAGEEGICKGCGVATLSISYESLGRKTGEMAAKILLEGADVSTMKVESADGVTKEYVKSYADMYGITPDSSYTMIEHSAE